MEILLYTVGLVAVLAGIAGLVLPALPGAPLLVAGVFAIAWADGFTRLGWPSLTVTVILGLTIMAVDFAASALGARAFGATKWAVIGSTIGIFVGLPFGLPGILLGPAIGAVAFEYWKDPNFRQAMRAGLGTFVGFLLGSVVKVALAFVVVGVVVLAWFF
ncbi:MAG TPA: DUF456 family protein [Anaeromyxobacteraceae bacterium]|nr:DUF456 family protein [Anaeromyxobacteraceae bacterium]